MKKGHSESMHTYHQSQAYGVSTKWSAMGEDKNKALTSSFKPSSGMSLDLRMGQCKDKKIFTKATSQNVIFANT